MSDNQVDGGSDNGTVTNANGDASGTQSVQQPSFDAAKLQSSIDALIGKVDELEARTNGLQSVKDKTTNEISGLKNQIAEYEKLKEKLGPEGALDQMELKQTLAEIKQQLSVSPQPPGKGVSGTVDVAKAFSLVGLDPKDPQVSVAMTKTYESEDHAIAAAVRLKTKLAESPAPTPAQGAALQGNPPAKKELVDEYIEEYKAALESGSRERATSVRRKWREKGVNVDAVHWSVS